MDEKKLARKIKKLYNTSLKEMKQKIEAQTAEFSRLEKIYKEKVSKGTMAKKDFLAWRKRELQWSAWAKDMYATLEKDLKRTNSIATGIINDETWEAYATGYNTGLYNIEKGIKATTSFNLYSKRSVERLLVSNPHLLPIAEESKWGEKRLRNAVAQAILQGESIDKFSKRLERVVNMESDNAVRNARTIMTSAQNGGRQKVAEDAEGIGIKLKKVWLATLDERTRHSHVQADGQERAVNDMFDVGGSKLMFPADHRGDPAEVYNCRCTMIYNVNGNISSVRPDQIERVSKIGDYDDWKRGR